MGAPWFKIHVQEFLSDSKILKLSHDQVGILLRLWCIACNDGSIPSDPKGLSRLIPGMTEKQMLKHLLWIKTFFCESETQAGALESIRLKSELAAYEMKVEKLRESGRKGGLTPKANAKANALPRSEANASEMLPEVEVEVEKEETLKGFVLTPVEPATRSPRKPSQKRAYQGDSLPEILGKGLVPGYWEEFWKLSGIWPETSNIRKKDSARAYVKARQDADEECILAWAEWTLRESGGKITTLAAWLENQDWPGRQEQRNKLAEAV